MLQSILDGMKSRYKGVISSQTDILTNLFDDSFSFVDDASGQTFTKASDKLAYVIDSLQAIQGEVHSMDLITQMLEEAEDVKENE